MTTDFKPFYSVALLTEHSEEYQRRIKELQRGPYSLAAVATRAELHRKHPRGEDQSLLRKMANRWLVFEDDKPP